ncbi:helix-turn-helix domain-containing protein [Gordonia aichiensis]|uniref:helix-turn-helix domain-containing protein n=1 Tax=Gordonia aichiensis TaxID=36820 RepID=UPI00326790E9
MQQSGISLNEVVGTNVKRLRQRHGWSQSELAHKLADELGKPKIDPTTITRMEAGTRPTTVSELEALSRVFDARPESFFESETADLHELRRILHGWAEQRARIIGAQMLMEGTDEAVWELVHKDPQILNGLDKRELELIDDIQDDSDARLAELSQAADDAAALADLRRRDGR